MHATVVRFNPIALYIQFYLSFMNHDSVYFRQSAPKIYLIEVETKFISKYQW